ncbi:hypothetical protein BJ684DRAFT_21013 [Piptocephalis cylindrospora]|uniref:Uncharacterized protein n=1 Tax=Piptocephalis cylindrospora TaxID=1907219 RepID=A0A4V1IXW2_9FUNG|nr:hypothetical protein BJ684DRAFT_21013 [Piptocephalis cylindrospora]|eukprot:RKP12449.1 hypothetical protein BJ684DRAFT_21013 [Piptocephalis cylindrospora]
MSAVTFSSATRPPAPPFAHSPPFPADLSPEERPAPIFSTFSFSVPESTSIDSSVQDMAPPPPPEGINNAAPSSFGGGNAAALPAHSNSAQSTSAPARPGGVDLPRTLISGAMNQCVGSLSRGAVHNKQKRFYLHLTDCTDPSVVPFLLRPVPVAGGFGYQLEGSGMNGPWNGLVLTMGAGPSTPVSLQVPGRDASPQAGESSPVQSSTWRAVPVGRTGRYTLRNEGPVKNSSLNEGGWGDASNGPSLPAPVAQTF